MHTSTLTCIHSYTITFHSHVSLSYTFIHTHIHSHTHTRALLHTKNNSIHTHTHTYTYAPTQIYTAYIHTHTHTLIQIYTAYRHVHIIHACAHTHTLFPYIETFLFPLNILDSASSISCATFSLGKSSSSNSCSVRADSR